LSPSAHGFGRGIKGKEPRRVHAYIPHQIPTRKVSKPPQENRQEKTPKITKKRKQEIHNQALRNHTESSIHTTKVHTRSSLPQSSFSLTRSHHEALKLVLEVPKANGRGKYQNKMS
jgi:hypothetical protein